MTVLSPELNGFSAAGDKWKLPSFLIVTFALSSLLVPRRATHASESSVLFCKSYVITDLCLLNIM